jgi:hypothetical protein
VIGVPVALLLTASRAMNRSWGTVIQPKYDRAGAEGAKQPGE